MLFTVRGSHGCRIKECEGWPDEPRLLYSRGLRVQRDTQAAFKFARRFRGSQRLFGIFSGLQSCRCNNIFENIKN